MRGYLCGLYRIPADEGDDLVSIGRGDIGEPFDLTPHDFEAMRDYITRLEAENEHLQRQKSQLEAQVEMLERYVEKLESSTGR